MKTLADWKNFYKQERESMIEDIKKEAIQNWNKKIDLKKILDVLDHDGILSFSHTFLRDNLQNYLNICKSLYLTNKSQIILIGVLHTREFNKSNKEFSLDNFEFILHLYSSINNLKPIKIIRKIFPSPPPLENNKFSNHVTILADIAKDIKTSKDQQTAILMTGDLSHYGYGYNTPKVKSHYKEYLKKKIQEVLDYIYNKGDYVLFREKSQEISNDQISPAIIAKEIIGKNVKICIIDSKISDYSSLLSAKKPTIVFSILYGVYLKQLRCQNKPNKLKTPIPFRKT